MKKNNYSDSIYYWLRNGDSIIIKKRFIPRIFATFAAVFGIPLMILLIYLFINIGLIFDTNIDFVMNLLMIFIYTGVPVISIISFFYVPTKIIFDSNNIKYSPLSFLSFNKVEYEYEDVEDLVFIQEKVISGFGGVVGYTDIQTFLVLNLKEKSLKLVKIKSKNIPSYYYDLKEEISLQIKKNKKLNQY